MLRFDDQFPIHRKVSGLTDAAFRLHVEAIFWCARNLTDGFIAQDDLANVSRYRRPGGYLTELVTRGAWDVVDGGWQIHDFLDWQQSRSKVLEVREARRKSGAVGGIKSGESRRKRGAKPKQVATDRLEARAPSPPLKGGLGGVGAGECRGFLDDGNGWCKRCSLPRVNKVHLSSLKQTASPVAEETP
jgi:hypothetical protein